MLVREEYRSGSHGRVQTVPIRGNVLAEIGARGQVRRELEMPVTSPGCCRSLALPGAGV